MGRILFPVFDRIVFAPIHSARATAMDDLMAATRSTGTPAVAAASVSEARRLAAQDASGNHIVISGSSCLVGEARSLLLAKGPRRA
jgi:folylpolyglutamate synthase/dihydropteroate synthase